MVGGLLAPKMHPDIYWIAWTCLLHWEIDARLSNEITTPIFLEELLGLAKSMPKIPIKDFFIFMRLAVQCAGKCCLHFFCKVSHPPNPHHTHPFLHSYLQTYFSGNGGLDWIYYLFKFIIIDLWKMWKYT